MKPNLLEAIADPALFRPYVTGDPEGSLGSWSAWCSFTRCQYGLPLDESEHELVKLSTGRDPTKLPSEGFDETLLLCGRRGGKSKWVALIAAAEACLSGREKLVAPGEIPMVAILSPTRNQSRIIHSYLRAVFDSSPVLQGEVKEESKEAFTLQNGVELAIVTGDPRRCRGFTLLCAVVDEVAFFGYTEESRVKSDTELVRAIRPSLATLGGKLLCVGTPYGARGHAYNTFKRSYGNDSSPVLCWYAASLTMNPCLSPKIVQNAVDEDPTAANVEFCTSVGLFREDVDSYVARSTIESCVISGRMELAPQGEITYSAFCDVSGGRHDDAALAIAHQEGAIVVVDLVERYPAPHNPHLVVAKMVDTLHRYALVEVTGDAYSAEWVKSTFASLGVEYRRATRSVYKDGIPTDIQKPKSQLFLELLPRLSSGTVELLDNEVLVSQLSNLQRRTRSGGRDTVDHPPGAKDDVANAVAGAVVCAQEEESVVSIGDQPSPGPYPGSMLDPLAQSMIEDMRMNPPRPDHPNDQFQEWLWRRSRGQRCDHPYLS